MYKYYIKSVENYDFDKIIICGERIIRKEVKRILLNLYLTAEPEILSSKHVEESFPEAEEADKKIMEALLLSFYQNVCITDKILSAINYVGYLVKFLRCEAIKKEKVPATLLLLQSVTAVLAGDILKESLNRLTDKASNTCSEASPISVEDVSQHASNVSLKIAPLPII